ncbi:hypothetical protein EMIHUDRAFT_97368 [Emiliania huxleyi CCMP1516]|uniref:RING-type domain-containing protein n=2 Tax=Emiliania huxleyi TaxID=2903 RepID=A0A0D3I2K8_EMIH1|nr:hypothetical protein EMIHUDRAFT_97368 [Emiliania huxleyi CCMP1516]EOD05493.1 hypothetical protein EMIHUDRAFT_97368 [Emiliania huxleyi CCMP1516]|eukprot:XP_005757922.1 hypothetical protein EMIHUDRAFT_97368 [Emiliania huxleyi CCMP1516]
MAPARASSSRATVSERLVLIPAINKNSTTGYKCVAYSRRDKKFQAQAQNGGKRVYLGSFDTAEEAASAYARSEYGRADAAKLLQPRPAPTAAGAEAIRQAEREGLTLATSSSSNTGYKGVCYRKETGSKKYQLQVASGGKQVSLGWFATAEQAALFYARREAGRDTSDLTAPPPPPPPPEPSTAAGAEAVRQAGREGLTLTTSSKSNSGYKGVTFYPKERGSKKYKLHVWVGSKLLHLGLFATAEQAALFYARREAGRDMAVLYPPPPPPPPPPAPSSAAGAEAIRQAEREGLTLATSNSSNSGYNGVTLYPKQQGSKKYKLSVRVGGRQVSLGWYAAAEEAALARARHLWDTTVRLLEPQPQQAPPQGAAGPSEASYEEEEDGFDPTDIAEAVALSLLPDPPSASEQRAARWQARAAEQAARADAAATAAAQAAAEAAPPWDDEVEVEAEQESDSEDESEMEVEAAAAARVAPAPAAEEPPQCAICLDDLGAHPEARLQPRDPNGWGATRCCKSLFHYHCLHAWLSDNSEVETSRGMEPINTTCPCCRGFVSKSASRMLA